ncbi:MAG: N-acetylglucosamine-6-phosphate deacetylase [Rhodobacteraceae bacterium]|nr:N-acetylglucosamine-6-phosphate deacetylase [Paracoccaceae bacterium]
MTSPALVPPPPGFGAGERGWLVPAGLFDGSRIVRGIALRLEGGTVAELRPAATVVAREGQVWRSPGIAAPGLFDLQVNGGGGVLFNSDPTPEGLARIVAAHADKGTERLLPTIITDTPVVAERAAETVLSMHARGAVAGLHLEGPHIAPARAGIHDPAHIRPFDTHSLALIERLRMYGVPVMVTLAPEIVPPETIAQLDAMGAVVALGHSDADAATAEKALAAGARMITHLFNAMSQMQGRAPGLVGAALGSAAWCSVIADGHHVDDRMIALALSARPQPGRMVLVSDAMPSLGGPGRFLLQGREIVLEGGRLVDASGRLAGAHLSLAGAVAHMTARLGLPLEAALHMALTAPAEAMRLAPARLVPGSESRFILVSEDGQQLVWFGGPAR